MLGTCNFHCRGVLFILIIVRQGPTVLAVGAGESFLAKCFSRLSYPSEKGSVLKRKEAPLKRQ